MRRGTTPGSWVRKWEDSRESALMVMVSGTCVFGRGPHFSSMPQGQLRWVPVPEVGAAGWDLGARVLARLKRG